MSYQLSAISYQSTAAGCQLPASSYFGRLGRKVGLAMVLVVLPVGLTAQSAPVAAVPVAARALPRGTVLAAADITMPAGDAVAADRLGWVTKRLVAEGELLREPAVAPPELVKSGDMVDVIWTDGLIQVRARGQASRAGTLGDKIFVRIDTRRRLEGVITGPGVVQLNSPER